MSRRVALAPLAAVGLALVATAPASAAFPGRNGVIVYSQAPVPTIDSAIVGSDLTGDQDTAGALHTIAPDGTGDRTLSAASSLAESAPFPSPDGRRIVYTRNGFLWLRSIDGSGARRLPRTDGADLPTWSPDGHRVLYSNRAGGISALDLSTTYTPQTKPTQLVPTTFDAKTFSGTATVLPLLSPDGKTLIYTQLALKFGRTFTAHVTIWAADAGGKHRHQLIPSTGDYRFALADDISPDGQHLVFLGASSIKKSLRRIFISNLDGSGVRVLTTAPAGDSSYSGVVWSPDGTTIVAARNERSIARGATLDLINVATGATSTLRHIAGGSFDAPRWQTLPAA